MHLKENSLNLGLAEKLLKKIRPESIALSLWSPPYHVGKEYEKEQSYEEWKSMLKEVISLHFDILKPGAFLVINIDDILCFKDESMPRIQAPNLAKRRCSVTREDVLDAKKKFPDFNRDQLAKYLKCSEQTIDRRLNGNNIRGGKKNIQTRVELVGSLIQEFARDAGLFLYDRRIWKKDPTWANSQWHSNSYRAVSEFEYLYFFWKPGETVVDRARLTPKEWGEWGSRGVWEFRSVQSNDIHEAMFPIELPYRLIRLLTEENDVVLDPFMGSGTTALAAKHLNRKYIGIEKEEKYLKVSKSKLSEMKILNLNFENNIQKEFSLSH